jgi:hypothetical protein
MPILKEGSAVRYAAKPVTVVEVPAPSVDDPGLYVQIDNVPQPADEDGNVAVRLRLSFTRHAGNEHNMWSVMVDEASEDIQTAVKMLIELVLDEANPAMGFDKIE